MFNLFTYMYFLDEIDLKSYGISPISCTAIAELDIIDMCERVLYSGHLAPDALQKVLYRLKCPQ